MTPRNIRRIHYTEVTYSGQPSKYEARFTLEDGKVVAEVSDEELSRYEQYLGEQAANVQELLAVKELEHIHSEEFLRSLQEE